MDEDELMEWDRSRRDHPSGPSLAMRLAGPRECCPRCGFYFKAGHLHRPFWRDDGPQQCQGCNAWEGSGRILVLGEADRKRRAHLKELHS